MLSLLTCSAPRIDDYDPYASQPLPRTRRASRSLSFIRIPSSKRKVSKMTIGPPENFRHEFHLGMDIISSDAVSLWDATRFLNELRTQQNAPLQNATPNRSTQPVSPSVPSPPPTPSTPTPKAQKRNSITPQKRKPVPSLLPEPRLPADIPLPPSPSETSSPPSPLATTAGPAPVSPVPLLGDSDHAPDASRADEISQLDSAPQESEHVLTEPVLA